jgi:hypothetical protein
VSGEGATIRIGTSAQQTRTFIAGIAAAPLIGARVVYISPSGQLGIMPSSERYKTDIRSMGAGTSRLGELRPVTYKLKTDPEGALQYGLIAEEVDRIYPELVIHNEQGQIDGVHYDKLAPMLLNEMQQQQKALAAQQQAIASQSQQLRNLAQQLAQVQELRQQLADLKQSMRPALASPAGTKPGENPADPM